MDDDEVLVDEAGAHREIADVLLVVVDHGGLVAQADVERRLGAEIAVTLRFFAGGDLRLQLLNTALQGREFAAQKIVLAERGKRRHERAPVSNPASLDGVE